MSSPRNVFFIGLRRSGTTIVWRLFRDHPGFTAYDEPFNPLLSELPSEHPKVVRAEFIQLYNRDPKRFRAHFAPITLAQETETGMTEQQTRYLQYLIAESRPVIMDITRCHWKLDALATVVPDAVVVHLHRHPVHWVYSHLVPSDHRDIMRIRRRFKNLMLFVRNGHCNAWGMQDLLLGPYRDATAQRIREEGVYLPHRNRPSYEALMAYWIAAYRRVERAAATLFQDRFLSMSLEAFCAQPREYIHRILFLAGAELHAFDTTALKPPTSVPRQADRRWQEAAAAAGATQEELQLWFPAN